MYRRSDIDMALEKIEVSATTATNKKLPKKRKTPDIFDLPLNEAADYLLTKNTPTQ